MVLAFSSKFQSTFSQFRNVFGILILQITLASRIFEEVGNIMPNQIQDIY